MSGVKTVDGFTFPLTFTDTVGHLYEAYYDEKGFWFKSVESGNVYRENRWDFGVFKDSVSSDQWEVVSQSIPKDPLVTIKQSEYDDLISEINALQELVKELSAPQDSALEQQAETYRALNETLTRHESFQEGDDGEFTSRCEQLLNTIDFLHEVYDDWKTNNYRAAVASAGSDAFKPISEYTLADWEQACKEGWVFECREGSIVRIMYTYPDGDYVLRGDDDLTRTINGHWIVGDTDCDDIVKRIK